MSPWERQVLADIERELATSDPHLARTFNGRGRRRAIASRWPVSLPATGLLLAGLLVLVLIGALLPASWWAVLGVVTALVVVPWLLLAATEKNGRG
ncbi:DUF3040 family protein [Pseudonocardia cypriaca]|uniref:DUF3040 family protein n=2 Tax=Pseudonocardia cypriaca TaxID=882449 RepID=A0A543FRR0_9PSEU|nr:DUF3040 family protein [Pseudonocardia cypriaca]